jgi:hypothetical protein
MRPALTHLAIFGALLAASLAVSFGLALGGEPSSLWLWRDVLGVVR